MKNKLGVIDALNTAASARQLTALLQNIFEKGTNGCQADDELIGLAYNISSNVSLFLDLLYEKENK